MMERAPIDANLADRLEKLTGETASCCIDELSALAADIVGADPFEQALTRAQALADENRLLTLALINRRGELCACEVQAALGCTHATVSHHMKVLHKAGLVQTQRRGKWVHYTLSPDATRILEAL